MSLTKTLKEIENQRNELAARVETLESELTVATGTISEMTTAHETALADLQELHSADAEAHAVAMAEVTTNATALEAERDTLQAENTRLSGELETATVALANPAFADAAIAGMNPVADGGEGGESGSLLDKFNKMEPAERTKFYREHKAELMAEARSVA